MRHGLLGWGAPTFDALLLAGKLQMWMIPGWGLYIAINIFSLNMEVAYSRKTMRYFMMGKNQTKFK